MLRSSGIGVVGCYQRHGVKGFVGQPIIGEHVVANAARTLGKHVIADAACALEVVEGISL